MFSSGSGVPQGYNYPVPSKPFIEGATVAPADYSDYSDYDPDDVPESQAAAPPRPQGYSYQVPDNPLVLPERVRGGKRVGEGEGEGTSHLLVVGLTHKEFDSYDPAEYDHNELDYSDFTLNIIGSFLLWDESFIYCVALFDNLSKIHQKRKSSDGNSILFLPNLSLLTHLY